MQANCVIWPDEVVEASHHGFTSTFWSPRAGGMYEIVTDPRFTVGFNDTQRARLTTWLVDQHCSGNTCPIVTREVLVEVDGRRDLRVSDKKRRFFRALVSMSFGLGQFIDVTGQSAKNSWKILCAWTECETRDQLLGLVRLLSDEGLIAYNPQGYRLTSEGYAHLEQAELGGADTKQAFVAMWFDPELTVAYDYGIAPAIKEAGFEPFRIDRKEHINKIDDEIIAEIRRSRFVVADFTCGLIDVGDKKQAQARGGVYYEAGFAQGLGTPVIWTVRKDCVDHVHFDTRQFAHIVWDDPADLKTKLLNRIRASIPGSA